MNSGNESAPRDMTSQRLLDILSATPAVDLDIVRIAQENLMPDGNINYNAMNADPEALREAAEQLGTHTASIRKVLRELSPDPRRYQ